MSNRQLVVLLIVVVLIFLVLLGIWFKTAPSSNNLPGSNATSSGTKALSEADKQRVQTTMLQFATSSKPVSSQELNALEQTINASRSETPQLGVQEQQAILKTMRELSNH